MALVPVTPSVALVSKLAAEDPDAAETLARFALYEAFSDLVDAHAPRLDRVAKHQLVAKGQRARRALVSKYIERRQAGEDVADLLAVAEIIAKASEWNEQLHPRDPDTGRFMRALKGDSASKRMGDAHDVATEWLSGGHVDAGAPVRLHGLDTEHDEERDVEGKITDEGTVQPDNDEELEDFDPSHISIDPRDVKTAKPAPEAEVPETPATEEAPAPQQERSTPRSSGGRAIDYGQTFIGHTGGGRTNGDFERNLRNFTEPTGAGDRAEGDRRAYRQLATTGQAVRYVSGGAGPAATVGAIAQVAGELGPQAERVLGPGIRRTAYRYRGTEREPNSHLAREVGDATDLSSALAAGNDEQVSGLRGRGLATGTAAHYAGNKSRNMSDDERDLRLRGDTAVGYFVNKIPDPDRAALSIEAGRVPPSQGAIIDRHGDVVTEAMGAGSDHYLPFDLKNLKSLQGGQYVRTRNAGGPSTEDIYTGLMGGARQIQVASNSGVFTVEFDPTLRGSRRYSDKSRQMISRYQALLNRISDSQSGRGRGAIYTSDLSPDEKQEITRRAYERAGFDPTMGKEYADTALEEARQRKMFEGPSDDELMEAARNKVLGARGAESMSTQQLARAVQDQFHEELRASKQDQVRRLQLDGQGYYAALQSLQEEFPYFIRNVDYQDLRSFTDDRTHAEPGRKPRLGNPRTPDTGFVRRGNITRHDSRQRGAPERNREREDNSGGVGSQGSGGPKPNTGGSGASGTGSGAKSTVKAAPFKPQATLATDPEELKAQLADQFDSLGLAVERLTQEPDEGVKESAMSGSALWLRAFNQQNYNGNWNKAGAQLAVSGTPAQLQKAVRAMDSLESLSSEAERSGIAGLTEKEHADVQSTKKTLQRLLATKSKPRKLEAGDRGMYDPSEHDSEPVAFDELDFDPSVENLQGWHGEQVKAGNQDYLKAHEALKGKSKSQRAGEISAKVRAMKTTKRWADAPDFTAKPAGAHGANQREARSIVENLGNTPQYKELEHLQLAHNYLTQLEGAGASGGGAGPKASGQGVSMPAQAWGARRQEETSKRRAPQRSVVHHRESTISKAMSRVLAERSRHRRS